jgi:undecaprenyl-diphosphatase
LSRPFLTPHMVKIALWIAAITLTLGTFMAVTRASVVAGNTVAADRVILEWMAARRTPALTGFMVGVTALGSPRFLAVLIIVTLAILIVRRDRRDIVHLIVVSLGVWALESVTKGLVARARPTEVEALVKVSGFSFPSGHSLATAALCLTIALIASSHLRARTAKAALIAGAAMLILLVALSRVYLGVHYPSDVLSGISLGTSWALMLAAAVAAIGAARRATT